MLLGAGPRGCGGEALGRLGRYYRSARGYEPGQIAARIATVLRRRTLHARPGVARIYYRAASPASDRGVCLLAGLSCSRGGQAPWCAESTELAVLRQRLREIGRGSFEFLAERVELGPGGGMWRAAGRSRLWHYHLHSFDYAFDLGALASLAATPGPYDVFRELLRGWIQANPLAVGPGWDAYPLSRRIVAWVVACDLFAPWLAADAASRNSLLASLWQQAHFLERNLEWDCRGNHLIENARALAMAGLRFRGATAERWLWRGIGLLRSQAASQIQRDGGHCERSVFYHAAVLRAYLEVIAAARAAGVDVPADLRDAGRRMAWFLAGVLHPDGDIPGFHDAVLGARPRPRALLALAAGLLRDQKAAAAALPDGPHQLYPQVWLDLQGRDFLARQSPAPAPASAAFPDTGYYVTAGPQGARMIVDGGEIGPSTVPAHGHCNVFGYELSCAGRRLIVDSGVDGYEAGAWRNYFRSTRAHNTLTVDGAEQSEIWASFRVGRRARVTRTTWRHGEGFVAFAGAHDGFVSGSRRRWHERWIVCLIDAGWVVVDRVSGEGWSEIESFVHFAPDAEVGAERGAFVVEVPEAVLRVVPFGAPQARVVRGAAGQGWVAFSFGRRRPASVLCLRRAGLLPAVCGYGLFPGRGPIPSLSGWGKGCAVEVQVAAGACGNWRIRCAGGEVAVERGSGR